MARPQAAARPAFARLRFLILLACAAVAAAQAARASPWIGGERAIASHALGVLDGVLFQESGLYAELGWQRLHTAVVLDAYVRTADDDVQSRGSILVERSVHARGPWALAVSAGPVFVGGQTCAGAGGEARAALGRNLGRRGLAAGFATLELAISEVNGCNDLKAALAVGYQPDSRWLLLAKSFSEQPRHGTDTLKVQLSAVRLGARRAVEYGLRARVDGGDPEPAIVVSIWRGRG